MVCYDSFVIPMAAVADRRDDRRIQLVYSHADNTEHLVFTNLETTGIEPNPVVSTVPLSGRDATYTPLCPSDNNSTVSHSGVNGSPAANLLRKGGSSVCDVDKQHKNSANHAPESTQVTTNFRLLYDRHLWSFAISLRVVFHPQYASKSLKPP